MISRELDAVHDLDSVLSYLRASATAQQAARVVKQGVDPAHVIGTAKGPITKIAKHIGTNQKLAEQLWRSALHEPRLLAVLVADPKNCDVDLLGEWTADLWSWSLTDQLARYLVPYVKDRDTLIASCVANNQLYPRRLGFASMACTMMHLETLDDDLIERYLEYIQSGAEDGRHHVRKAVVWALVEIGKNSDAHQQRAIEAALELEGHSKAAGWVARNALRELEQLVKVPERRRLLSQRAKTAKTAKTQ